MKIIKHNSMEQNEIVACKIIDVLNQHECTLVDVHQFLEFVNDILKYQKISSASQIIICQD